MVKFEFIILNTKAKQLQLLSNILLAVNGLLFVFFATQLANTKWAFITATIGLGVAIFNIFSKKSSILLNNIAIVIIAIGWIKLGYWWVGLLLITIDWLGKQVTKNKTIVIGETDITVSQPLPSKYQWNQFQNIVLKDGLLTLDFKNNKLLQAIITNEINEQHQAEFNDFCHKLIISNIVNE